MVIPTLRVSDYNNYNLMIENFKTHNIKILRVNMVRYPLKRYCQDIKYIKSLNNSISLMCDIPLPGTKYRLSIESGVELQIEKGEIVTFSVENFIDADKLQTKIINVNVPSFRNVCSGDTIIIGDGELSLRVEDNINNNLITAIADNDSIIRGKRAFIIPNKLTFELYTEKKLEEYINALQIIRPQFVVLSFAENIEILLSIERALKNALGANIGIIPKIETPLGISNLEIISKKYSSIMLGRGDLALFGGPNKFALYQESLLEFMQKSSKVNVIAATDILTSLYTQHIPSRADLTDLYYLQKMGIHDVVSSAGISINGELFNRFCRYAENCI